MMTPHDNAKCPHWTGFAASIPGGGHIRHGIPCQDASAVMTSPRPAVIVCDGRGSAKLSHFGAQGAVDAFRFQMSILDPFLVSILDGEEEKPDQWIKFCRIMYRTLMQVKYDLAEKHNEEEKEFDCTVAFAIAGEKHIGCFQVGDGSIVVRQNGVCKTVFLPEKGEFANQTHFLRPGGEEQMKFQYALLNAGVNSGIAITSDGPEHLMFRLADMTPGKIFDMFLEDLRKEELCKQDLMDYLTRREWADDPRGSDDRSLALLARVGVEPAVEPAAADANEPVPQSMSEIKSEMPPENESSLEHPAEVCPEPEQESHTETEVQTEAPAVPAETKKKRDSVLDSGCGERSCAGTPDGNGLSDDAAPDDLPAADGNNGAGSDDLPAADGDSVSEAENRAQEASGTGVAKIDTPSAEPTKSACQARCTCREGGKVGNCSSFSGSVRRNGPGSKKAEYPRKGKLQQHGYQRKNGKRKHS